MEQAKTEDELLLLDVDSKRSRNRDVRLEGYNSDSSDEEEEEDDDDETKKDARNTKVRFVETEEDKDGIELPDLEENDDIMVSDDEDRENKATSKEMESYFNNQEEDLSQFDRSKVKRSKGPKIEAFNLDKEHKQGEFDEVGNYIKRDGSGSDDDDDDEDDEDEKKVNSHDSWLVGMDNKEIAKAKEAELKRQEMINERLNNEKIMRSKFTIPDLLKRLIPLLQPSETSLEGLQRLNSYASRLKKSLKRDKDNHVLSIELYDAKAKINVITETVEILQAKSKRFGSIYDMERELLIREYENQSGESYEMENVLKRKLEENEQDDDDENADADDQWEYHWDTDPTEIHGPYPLSTLQAWLDSNYFDEIKGFARKCGSNDEFTDIELLLP